MPNIENSQSEPQEECIEKVAFLIVNGKNILPLHEPVINIGRASDNHIVIERERISRYHAQIRCGEDEFIICDLNSTIGTSINGIPIDKAVLQAGDVISLGGVPIIFGQGSSMKELELQEFSTIDQGDSKPTANSEIESVDNYLDFFEISDE